MTQPMKQYEVLKWASLFLTNHQREEKVGEMLLQHYLGLSRAAFFANMREPVDAEITSQFKQAITRHVETGIPVQHLMGYEMFYGRKFTVNGHTLIPRPETEELVLEVIKQVRERPNRDQPLTIVDIGTGSGIIAITLALELENVHVYATDISPDALAVARQNADNLGVKVTFYCGDFLQPIIDHGKRADIVVSNPPYISRADEKELTDTVKQFDPEIALFAEENGLYAYRKIISQLPKVVENNAYIAFEIGYQQKESVQQLLNQTFPTAKTACIKDINQKNRIVTAKLEN